MQNTIFIGDIQKLENVQRLFTIRIAARKSSKTGIDSRNKSERDSVLNNLRVENSE